MYHSCSSSSTHPSLTIPLLRPSPSSSSYPLFSHRGAGLGNTKRVGLRTPSLLLCRASLCSVAATLGVGGDARAGAASIATWLRLISALNDPRVAWAPARVAATTTATTSTSHRLTELRMFEEAADMHAGRGESTGTGEYNDILTSISISTPLCPFTKSLPFQKQLLPCPSLQELSDQPSQVLPLAQPSSLLRQGPHQPWVSAGGAKNRTEQNQKRTPFETGTGSKALRRGWRRRLDMNDFRAACDLRWARGNMSRRESHASPRTARTREL